MKTPGKFKCLKCGHEFETFQYCTSCHKCEYLYVKWLNYEECRKCWDHTKGEYENGESDGTSTTERDGET